jgi:hypothetical protein
MNSSRIYEGVPGGELRLYRAGLKGARRRRSPLLYLLPIAAILALLLAYYALAASGAPEIDGIKCEVRERLVYHIHVKLQIYNNSQPVTVPAGIGIKPNCLYWLHTHDASGLIHVESPVNRTFTLGNFIDIWGVSLSPTSFFGRPVPPGSISVTVNGQSYLGDFRQIPLIDGETIAINYTGP